MCIYMYLVCMFVYVYIYIYMSMYIYVYICCNAAMCPAVLQGAVPSHQVHQLMPGTNVGCSLPNAI